MRRATRPPIDQPSHRGTGVLRRSVTNQICSAAPRRRQLPPVPAIALPLLDLRLGVGRPVPPKRAADVVLRLGELPLVITAYVALVVLVRLEELSVSCHDLLPMKGAPGVAPNVPPRRLGMCTRRAIPRYGISTV